jgi:hypothetical protein
MNKREEEPGAFFASHVMLTAMEQEHVEITKKMINAGVEVLSEAYLDEISRAEIVKKVFLVMRQLRISQDDKNKLHTPIEPNE